MARPSSSSSSSSSSSTTVSTSRSKKKSASSSSTTAVSSSNEGKTPHRQPRRRTKKQPKHSNSNSSNSNNDDGSNMMDEDGDYSFLGQDDSNKSSAGAVKNSHNNGSAVDAGRRSGRSDKENEDNHYCPPRQQQKQQQDDNHASLRDTMKVRGDNKTTTKKKKLHQSVDELNDAMAKVSLDSSNNNTNNNNNNKSLLPLSAISEYTMGACPPVGYGTNQITVDTPKNVSNNNDSNNNSSNSNNNRETEIQIATQIKSSLETIVNTNHFTTNTSTSTTTTTTEFINKSLLLSTKNTSLLLEAIVSSSSSYQLTLVKTMLIEENCGSLVDLVKKCLKVLTSLSDDSKTKSRKKSSSSSSSSNNDDGGSSDKLEMALLRVAIHTLRSITPTLHYNNENDDTNTSSSSKSNSMYEIVIKLFYHCVVIAGDACYKKFQLVTTTSGNTSVVKEVLEYALLCLASYEGLGRLLHTTNQKKLKNDGMIPWDEMLPLPTKAKSTSTTPLPHKQLVKIALESSQCAASSLLYLSLISLHLNAGNNAASTTTKKSKSDVGDNKRKWCLLNEFHFVSSIIYETCSGKFEGNPPMFQRMLTNVTLPYVLQSLLLDVKKGSDGVTTITNMDVFVRQVKKVYRILLDGGRSIEEVIGNTTPSSNSSSSLRICSLNLYCEAILFILDALHQCFELYPKVLHDKVLSDTDQSEIKALFDRASSSAMKSAATFEKSSGSRDILSGRNKESLLQFHTIVGNKLDLTRKRLSQLRGGGVSASYYEYCTYRSVHLFRLTSSYISSSFSLHNERRQVNDADDDCLVAMWTFFVVDASLQARHGLLSTDTTTMEDVELILSTFEKRIVNASASIQSRSRSMILLTELHKEATKLLFPTSDDIQSDKAGFLAAMGSILGRCLAPIEMKLARSQKESSRSMNYRLSSSDIHAKAALFYCVASEVSTKPHEKERHSSRSDSQLHKSFDILMKTICSVEEDEIDRNTQCVSAVEMFAKIATFIGKRTSSIQAQLYAVELLSKMSIKASSVEMFDKYQISNRYMMLASALESSGHMGESIATMAVAVWSVIEEMKMSVKRDSSDEDEALGDSISEHVLLFPDKYASMFESNESMVSSILNKLTRTYVGLKQSSPEAKMASDSNMLAFLDKTLIGKLLDVASSASDKESKCETNCHLNLSKLLHYAVWNQKRYEVLPSAQMAEIVREVLLSITKTLNRCISTENDSIASHLVEEAKTFLQVQKKRMGDVMDHDIHQVISSSFHTYFAAILMEAKFIESPHPSSWIKCEAVKGSAQVLLKHSYNQLQHADGLFKEDSTNDDSIADACFFAQWAAVQFHQAVLMEHMSLAKISGDDAPSNGTRSFVRYNHLAMEKYRSSLSACGRAIELFDEEIFIEVVQSLLFTLERLLYRFSVLGDPMCSAEAFSLVQQVCSSISQPQKLIRSISAFMLAAPKLEISLPLFNQNSHFRQNIESISLDEEEGVSSDLIQCARGVINSLLHAVDTKSIESFEENSLLELSNYYIENMDHETLETMEADEVLLGIQIQQLVARSLFLISKICLDIGKPLSALEMLWSCRRECKKQMNMMRSVGKCRDDIMLEGKLEQNDDLISMCYEGIASAFSFIGIRRKAEDYAILTGLKRRILNSEDCQRVSQVNIQELVDLGCDLDGLNGVLNSVRTIMRIKFYSSSPDKMANDALEFKSGLLPKMESFDAASIHQYACRTQTLLTYYDSLQNMPSFRSRAHTYIERAYQTYGELEQYVNENGIVQSDMFLSGTHAELKVRKFLGTDDKSSVATLLSDVAMTNNAPEMCHVQAQYELGLIALHKARDRGELFTLWQDFFVTSGKTDNSEFSPLQYTFEARKHFQSALNHAGPSATKLTKDILRCLALTTGPEDTDASSFYVNSSIGGSSRAAVLDIFSNQTGSNCSTRLQDNIQSLFQMFDDEKMDCRERIGSFRTLLSDSVSLLPHGWNLSSLAICPTGEILVSTIRKESTEKGHSTIRISNVCIMRCNQNRDAHSDLLIPLDQIINRSQMQLHGMTEEAQTEQYNEESVRRKWWNERHKINDDLRSLLQYAQAEYFGHDLMQEALLPSIDNHTGQQCSSSIDDESSSECSGFGPARLASRFEQVELEPDTASLKKLTVAVLKERLTSLGVATAVFQKMRKAELVELLASEMEKNSEDSIMDDAQETPDYIRHQSSGESCTILVLDEHLQRFPFESMDMFTNKAVTRVPTLPLIFATLMERKSLNVDPTMISYVLDPESNLSETASTLGPALTTLASSRGWEWDGVIGEMPTSDFMTNILTRDLGMFLYCGHGGGEKFFSRNNVEEIMVSRDDGARGCRPPVVLMGCSSGKLQSVNCPKDNASGQAYSIHYEPEGIALSYLIAGAPCVVGNLWDVTDRDIDRYCLTLMEDFIKEGESMAKCVADARRACKLRYIVGSAPVCYGVPVKCSSTTNS